LYIITPNMNRSILIILFLLIANADFAQKGKDTVVYNLPVVNGRVVYTDSINIKGKSKAVLDSAVQRWFTGYFKSYRPDTLAKDRDANSNILSQVLLEFRNSPNSYRIVYYNFYLIMTIKVNCKDGYYTYTIFDIFFRPKSGFVNAVIVHPTNMEYLIELYKKKHRGLYSLDKSTIRSYLFNVNSVIQTCIASLNKAMIN